MKPSTLDFLKKYGTQKEIDEVKELDESIEQKCKALGIKTE